MRVELTGQERRLLLRLVDAELRELGPEIHHTRTGKDPLKEQRRELLDLREHLELVLPEEADTETFPSVNGDLLGTP